MEKPVIGIASPFHHSIGPIQILFDEPKVRIAYGYTVSFVFTQCSLINEDR